MNILFVTHSYPNYVPDLLLHGLRKVLGAAVVDYPKKDCVYQGVLGLGVCPDDQLCPGWFPADDGQVDREDISHKVKSGYFDFVVCDLRAVTFLKQEFAGWPDRLVIIDGEDSPTDIPPGKYIICRRETDGADFSIPLPMALPEEIFSWISHYDDIPKSYSIGFLGSTQDDSRRQIVEAIAAHFPDALLQTSIIPNENDPSPAGRLGRDEYYQLLQKCQVLLSLPGAGYDTFRFWENAACNGIHVSTPMPLFIPNDFQSDVHIFRAATLDKLKSVVDQYPGTNQEATDMVQQSRKHLIRFHLTARRAEYFIDKIRSAYAG